MQPELSVIVPIYKVEPWLRRCVDSILNQTFKDFECILVDDGSPDNCGAICDEYAAADPRIRVLHQQNGGVSAARNAGLAVAAAPWIAFCDSDDALSPRSFENMLQMQKTDTNAHVMWHYSENWDDFVARQNEPLAYKRQTYSSLVWRVGLFSSVVLRLYSADALRRHALKFDTALGWKEKWDEDEDFNNRYFAAYYPSGDFTVLITEQPFYFYFNENESSLTTSGADEGRIPELPAPEPDYCNKLFKEYNQQKCGLSGDISQKEQGEFVRHYLHCLAYGIWSAKQLGEPLPAGLYKRDELAELLGRCKQHKIYSAYYLPFRLKATGFIRRLYAWDETRNINYHRSYEIFYRLFFKGWQK